MMRVAAAFAATVMVVVVMVMMAMMVPTGAAIGCFAIYTDERSIII